MTVDDGGVRQRDSVAARLATLSYVDRSRFPLDGRRQMGIVDDPCGDAVQWPMFEDTAGTVRFCGSNASAMHRSSSSHQSRLKRCFNFAALRQ